MVFQSWLLNKQMLKSKCKLFSDDLLCRSDGRMTSIIKLTALSGVQEESALCYLLQVDEFRFLLDCGWDESFSMDIIDSLKRYDLWTVRWCYWDHFLYVMCISCAVSVRYVHQVDAVLLSHPDHLHLGALPYAVGKLGLNCTIYATIPVYKMGQMFMYDLYQVRWMSFKRSTDYHWLLNLKCVS